MRARGPLTDQLGFPSPTVPSATLADHLSSYGDPASAWCSSSTRQGSLCSSQRARSRWTAGSKQSHPPGSSGLRSQGVGLKGGPFLNEVSWTMEDRSEGPHVLR